MIMQWAKPAFTSTPPKKFRRQQLLHPLYKNNEALSHSMCQRSHHLEMGGWKLKQAGGIGPGLSKTCLAFAFFLQGSRASVESR